MSQLSLIHDERNVTKTSYVMQSLASGTAIAARRTIRTYAGCLQSHQVGPHPRQASCHRRPR